MIRVALTELRRRPSRFVVATLLVAFLTILVLLLGALLDGLFLGSTGAIRSQKAEVFVYSESSRESFLRSRITPELRDQIDATPGVTETGGLGLALVGAEVPGESDLANAAVVGYELPAQGVPSPPPPGQAYADERLKGDGVGEGDVLLLGPQKVPIEVIGFVKDTNYLLQGALWVEGDTWREVQSKSRPDATVGPGVWQVVLANGDGPAGDLADAIDAQTGGATTSLTKAEAEQSLPGTREQNATFTFIIVFAYLVVLLVVALFFALLVRERTGLLGVFKAIGANTWQLAAGLVAQAVLVALIAFALGFGVVSLLRPVIPPEVPISFQPSRAVVTLLVLVVVSVIGSALSLRRVAKVDPASAIGSAS